MVAVSETTSMLDEALTLAGCGFVVFPLHPRTKTPATEHGFKDATTDVAQIRAWWTKTPDANIGIATGEASGGLVVIDIDVDEAKGKDGRRSVPERVDNGGRNKAMISYVGKMQQMGATDETIEAYAAEFNETRMAEALDEEELTKTVDSGLSYEKGPAFGAPGSPFKGIEFIPRNEKEWSRVFAKWLYGKVCFVPEVRSVLNSLRRGGSRFWVFYSFNPPKTAMSWVNKETLARKQREDTLVWKTSYLDVASSHPEWLGGPFIEEAEYLRKANETAWRWEFLGDVVGTDGNVFSNTVEREVTDEEIPLTFEEFTMKEYERDRDGSWLDIIPDGQDHSIDTIRYAMMDDVLRG